MGNYTRHPGVDAYFEPLPEWHRATCDWLRDLIHEAEPEIVETIKQRVQPENKTARMISFYRDETVQAEPLVAMVRQIAANNRAGGWRKVRETLQVPH